MLYVLQKYPIFFFFFLIPFKFFTKSAAYFPSDMSFLCPNIKTKKLSTERRLILAMIIQLNQKLVPGIKRGSWKPETQHSNKHLIVLCI